MTSEARSTCYTTLIRHLSHTQAKCYTNRMHISARYWRHGGT